MLLDLVPNHTSSAHPWFIDAASGRDAAHRGLSYVWADPRRAARRPPTGSTRPAKLRLWQWHAETGQYYLHNFLPAQPDLNWWQLAVHAEFRQILEFWFNRGVAGFRIDIVAHGLYKDAPSCATTRRCRCRRQQPGATRWLARFGQRPVYNANRPETHSVYRDWRKIADSYSPPRLLLGETWTGDLANLASYYGDVSTSTSWASISRSCMPGSPAELPDLVDQTLAALPPGACPVWTGSNHDVGPLPQPVV